MQNLYKETKFIMNKYNIIANKSLGQNFLVNEEAINKIIESADIKENDLIIEIGPGLGTLTNELLKKTKNVVCIELDTRMCNIIKERFILFDNIEIINEDVLKVNISELINKYKKEYDIKNAKVVANLPYYITTPIIMKLLEDKLNIESITIMIQKEVAQRLIANPGDNLAGAITYGVYYYTIPESVMLVDRSSFIPSPEVDSEVIKLNVRKEEPYKVKDKDLLFKIIKFSFMQRRKTLVNALFNSGLYKSKDEIENVLESLGIDKNIRGEKLTLEQFVNIANLK